MICHDLLGHIGRYSQALTEIVSSDEESGDEGWGLPGDPPDLWIDSQLSCLWIQDEPVAIVTAEDLVADHVVWSLGVVISCLKSQSHGTSCSINFYFSMWYTRNGWERDRGWQGRSWGRKFTSAAGKGRGRGAEIRLSRARLFSIILNHLPSWKIKFINGKNLNISHKSPISKPFQSTKLRLDARQRMESR